VGQTLAVRSHGVRGIPGLGNRDLEYPETGQKHGVFDENWLKIGSNRAEIGWFCVPIRSFCSLLTVHS
jgi:hypothetical protein